MARPTIEPVTEQLLPEFAEFLYENLSRDRDPQGWQKALRTHWGEPQPNFGFVLRDEGRIVGGIGAIYAKRRVQGRDERFCNITSWCVQDAYRKQSMRLAMAVVEQSGYTFTDFSPTKIVSGSLRFLKFKPLDDRVTVILNLPRLFAAGTALTDPAAIAASLKGDALQAYRDHDSFPWLRHVVIGKGSAWCHVIYKDASIKGLPAARIIHVSDRTIFNRYAERLTTHLLSRGVVSTHVETRHLTRNISPSRIRAGFIPKVYLSATLQESDIDYLYSETVAMDL